MYENKNEYVVLAVTSKNGRNIEIVRHHHFPYYVSKEWPNGKQFGEYFPMDRAYGDTKITHHLFNVIDYNLDDALSAKNNDSRDWLICEHLERKVVSDEEHDRKSREALYRHFDSPKYRQQEAWERERLERLHRNDPEPYYYDPYSDKHMR